MRARSLNASHAQAIRPQPAGSPVSRRARARRESAPAATEQAGERNADHQRKRDEDHLAVRQQKDAHANEERESDDEQPKALTVSRPFGCA